MAVNSIVFSGRKYFLHLRDRATEERTKAELIKRGGEVVDFLTADVDVLVTDHPYGQIAAKNKKTAERSPVNCKTECDSGRSSSRSSRVSGHCSKFTDTTPLDNSRLRRASGSNQASSAAVKDRVPGGIELKNRLNRNSDVKSAVNNVPTVIKEADRMGVKIVVFSKFQPLLRDAKPVHRRTTISAPKKLPASKNAVSVMRFQEPFIKTEQRSKFYRPFFEQLNTWPAINLDKYQRGCIFSQNVNQEKDIKIEVPSVEEADAADACTSSTTPTEGEKRKGLEKHRHPEVERLLNLENGAVQSANLTTNSKKLLDRVQDAPGYCELCSIRTRNVSQHLSSSVHQRNLGSPAYTLLDFEMERGPQLENLLYKTLFKVDRESPVKSPIKNANRGNVSSPSPAARHKLDKSGAASDLPTVAISACGNSPATPRRYANQLASPKVAYSNSQITPKKDNRLSSRQENKPRQPSPTFGFKARRTPRECGASATKNRPTKDDC